MVTAIVNEYKNNSDISCYNDVWIERHKTVDQLFKRLTEGREVHDVVKLDDNHLIFGFFKEYAGEKIYIQYELVEG